jgi:hypothetical protein
MWLIKYGWYKYILLQTHLGSLLSPAIGQYRTKAMGRLFCRWTTHNLCLSSSSYRILVCISGAFHLFLEKSGLCVKLCEEGHILVSFIFPRFCLRISLLINYFTNFFLISGCKKLMILLAMKILYSFLRLFFFFCGH